MLVLIEGISVLGKTGSCTDARQLNDYVMWMCVEERTQSSSGWLPRIFLNPETLDDQCFQICFSKHNAMTISWRFGLLKMALSKRR